MVNDDCRLRYAAGKYWIHRCSKFGEYLAPVVTNETGSYIWKCLDDGMDIKSTVVYIARLYGIPENEADEDVKIFCEILKRNGCLKNE